ncbi:TIGR03757 family integrating conjugative element protein [Erwinia rhapontici]|uniref:TIGR03757 family integrating conjugative element protein n=1 Tax=Erwinia rhapontici TaxID=55212 RepID=UPI003D35EEC1
MKRLVLFLPALCLSAGACAGTVVYTDSTHPVASSFPDTHVVYIDAPERMQADMFGTLPSNQVQAEKLARDRINTPEFAAQQQKLTIAYQGLMKAWSLGLAKYPAVVFDDKWVVYGTTDVSVAMQQMSRWREVNP